MVKVRIFVRLAMLFMIVYSFLSVVEIQLKDTQLTRPDAPTSSELAEIPDEVLEEIEVEAHEYP